MADARTSVVAEIMELFGDIGRAAVRWLRWSLSSVEDGSPPNVIPMPGPAHGPIPMIELRREERRKAS